MRDDDFATIYGKFSNKCSTKTTICLRQAKQNDFLISTCHKKQLQNAILKGKKPERVGECKSSFAIYKPNWTNWTKRLHTHVYFDIAKKKIIKKKRKKTNGNQNIEIPSSFQIHTTKFKLLSLNCVLTMNKSGCSKELWWVFHCRLMVADVWLNLHDHSVENKLFLS